MDNTELGKEAIEDRTNYHPPSDEGAARHKALSDAFTACMEEVDRIVPGGREKSLAFTNLEQAKMWASAGVARNPETV